MRQFLLRSLVVVVVIAALSWWNAYFLWGYVLAGPFILLGIYGLIQKKHTLLRNYPLLGHGRYFMEELRPKIYQYFIESDTDGAPINRILRSVVYQRAKKELDTTPFGTQMDVYADGYEWVNHSAYPVNIKEITPDPRINVGSKQCSRPYHASLLNVSAMSYGALSKNAVMALNGGAAAGAFAHNTGEGGISPYHLKHGGDLIWQIGTGYFGCRDNQGNFSREKFQNNATRSQVKMIEIKLSQGAKPGHGGILPAHKNTQEIAAIRDVEPGKEIASPPYHTAFSGPESMLDFIDELRELSGGKPVGFKLCVGDQSEFLEICEAITKKGIYPDFITVDGGEGGTGAAPMEFSNSVGMPYREGLAFVYDALKGYGIKDQITVIASGKIITSFHIYRALALGADLCYSARAMMLALGCIQALECNKNTCPTGITTHKPDLVNGLVVSDKKQRVATFHKETLESFCELMAATGLRNHKKINRRHINRRTESSVIKRYDEIYPYVPENCLKNGEWPESFKIYMDEVQ